MALGAPGELEAAVKLRKFMSVVQCDVESAFLSSYHNFSMQRRTSLPVGPSSHGSRAAAAICSSAGPVRGASQPGRFHGVS